MKEVLFNTKLVLILNTCFESLKSFRNFALDAPNFRWWLNKIDTFLYSLQVLFCPLRILWLKMRGEHMADCSIVHL